jgi:hypothetical protein
LNRLKIESGWKDLVLALRMQPPINMSSTGLLAWARPTTPHPARQNRAVLYEVLNLALKGELHEAENLTLPVQERIIHLSTVAEFKDLMQTQPDRSTFVARDLVKSWLAEKFPKATKNLMRHDDEEVTPILDHTGEYLRNDTKLYMQASLLWERYEDERVRLEEMREVLEEIDAPDKIEQLQLLDDFFDTVLLQIAQSVDIIEQTRDAAFQHMKSVISTFIMRSAGLPTALLEFPSFDEVEDELNKLPTYAETDQFRAYQNNCSFDVIKQKFSEYVELVNERFDGQVEIDQATFHEAMKKGSLNIQINTVFGEGAIKAVNTFSPETTLFDG